MRLELRGIVKRFGPLVANDVVDLTIESGEIHSLLGENGAGKTTLMNVASGVYRPDGGELLIDGRAVSFSSSRDAIAAGVSMVHQHFALVPVFTAAEAILLGAEPVKGPFGWFDRQAAGRLIRERAEQFGLVVDPDAIVERQPVGVQQRIEIMRALMHNARVLILDEPTAVLTPQEVEQLFGVMRRLRDDGRAIVFISHKLGEVKEISDRITVMRAGGVVGSADPTRASPADLANMMVGRPVMLEVVKPPAEQGSVSLRVEHLSATDGRGNLAVDDVSFDVRAGEILAVAGVQGNGQTELVRCIYGLLPAEDGRVSVCGQDITGHSPRDIAKAGVGYIAEDRGGEGLAMSLSVADNLVLGLHDDPQYRRGVWVNRNAVLQNAKARMREYDIRGAGINQSVSALSGGNQQKVILARELSRDLQVLIASQPTRGLDVGSVETVHQRLLEERSKGVAVLLVSVELDEVQALADRILVMYRGQVVGVVGPETDRSALGLMMAGGADTGLGAEVAQ